LPRGDQNGGEQADHNDGADADTDCSRQVRSRGYGQQQLRQKDRRGGENREPRHAANDELGFVPLYRGEPQRQMMRRNDEVGNHPDAPYFDHQRRRRDHHRFDICRPREGQRRTHRRCGEQHQAKAEPPEPP
jgi:hypothetical protein